MESTCRAAPTDRLSTLPVELLEWIFELAYEDGEHTTTGAISRALLPFDRKERFKRIQRPSPPFLRRLFSSLPNLRILNAGWHSDTILDFVFSPLVHGTLSSIHLLGVAPYASGDWDFQHLDRMPNVRSLYVDLTVCYDPSNFPGLEYADARFPSITSLTLKGSKGYNEMFSFNTRSVAAFLGAFPDARTVVLEDTTRAPAFDQLLPSLPREITSLSLLTARCSDHYSAPCDDLLPRFSHLTSLTLGMDIFNRYAAVENLRALPSLTSLTFALGADISASYLLSFVSGSTRHPSLTRLTLDVITLGKRGWRIQQDGGGKLHPRHDEGEQHTSPDWVIPEYAPYGRFYTADVEDLVKAGEKSGVEVVGSAVEGIEVYRDWFAEAVECLLVYGREHGDYDQLRVFIGDEKAERLLRVERLWRLAAEDGNASL
ncbi:hypothetical protein JCM6882_000452 [Rhodosporidiobolus microsporus]